MSGWGMDPYGSYDLSRFPNRVGAADPATWRDIDAITAALTDARRRVDRGVGLVHTLRAIADDRASDVDISAIVGPLSAHREAFGRPEIRAALRRWQDYFRPDLDDVDTYHREIDAGRISDLRAIYDVVDILDDLLSAAEHAIDSTLTQEAATASSA